MKELMKYEFRRRKASQMISMGTAAVGLFLMLSGLLFWKAAVVAFGFVLLFVGLLFSPFYAGVESILLLNRDLQNGQNCMLWMVPRSVLQIFGAEISGRSPADAFFLLSVFLSGTPGSGGFHLERKRLHRPDQCSGDFSARTRNQLDRSDSGCRDSHSALAPACYERLFRRSAFPNRAGGFQAWRTSFLSAVLADQSCLQSGLSGDQQPFHPVRSSVCGLVCL